jgi:RNA polymerase sigma-70 factor (ECF subfamily)
MASTGTSDRPEAGASAQRLGALFDAHQARLYRLARRMLTDGEEARDLVQEAFVRAARRPAAVPTGEGAAAAWLTRVLVNLCRDRHRRLAVRRREAPRPEPAQEPVAERRLAARSAVQAALARLSPRRRAVVVLHELEERSVAEIAHLLGLARPTVRWHLAVARKDLATILLAGDPP